MSILYLNGNLIAVVICYHVVTLKNLRTSPITSTNETDFLFRGGGAGITSTIDRIRPCQSHVKTEVTAHADAVFTILDRRMRKKSEFSIFSFSYLVLNPHPLDYLLTYWLHTQKLSITSPRLTLIFSFNNKVTGLKNFIELIRVRLFSHWFIWYEVHAILWRIVCLSPSLWDHFSTELKIE